MNNRIEEILKTYAKQVKFYGVVDSKEIQQVQSTLNVVFPADYRCFIKKYGCLSFAGTEIYGIVPQQELNSVPSTLWATSYLRKQNGLNENYVVVGCDGFGSYYCLDTKQLDRKKTYLVFLVDCQNKHCKVLEPVAKNFDDFLREQLEEQLEVIEWFRN